MHHAGQDRLQLMLEACTQAAHELTCTDVNSGPGICCFAIYCLETSQHERQADCLDSS